MNNKALSTLLLCLTLFINNNINAQTTWNLKQCVDTALTRNTALLKSKTGNEINNINIQEARYRRLPDLSFLGSETYNHFFNPTDFSGNAKNATIGSYGLNSSLLIFNGGSLKKKIEQSRLSYEVGEIDQDALRKDISLNIVYAYLQVLYGYEQIETDRDLMEKTKKQLENTQLLVTYGKLPQASLSQMKAQLASQQYSLTKSENQLYSAKVDLMLMMEIPLIDGFEVEKPLVPDSNVLQQTVSASSKDIFSFAVQNQPEIKSAELNIKIAEMNTSIAQSAYYPTLNLTGNIGTTHSSASKTSGGFSYAVNDQIKDNLSSSVGLSLQIPIFNRWSTKANVLRSQLYRQTAIVDKKYAETQLRKEIEQAYTDMTVASRNFESALEYVKATKETFANAELKYNSGLMTALDLMNERNSLISATSQFIQAKYQFFFKVKVLDFYQGKPLY